MYESEIEQIAINILRDENGYTVLFGPDISEGELKERAYAEVTLQNRLRDAIERINQSIRLCQCTRRGIQKSPAHGLGEPAGQ